jgi:GNAT superfamily N-acetyltransferase
MDTGTIRPATQDDLPRLLDLASQRRADYALAQPRFWRPATDAVERQRPHFARQLADEHIITLVHDRAGKIGGFIIATLIAAPPVVDPGGETCLVDDFAVADPADWPTIGADLLAATRERALSLGAVQLVVISGHHDAPKRAMLATTGHTIASEWWLTPLTP